jgi:hypothetical protein
LAAVCFDPPQTVHVTFIALKPLFFTRGNTEEESHGNEEEKEEAEQIEVKRRRASYWGASDLLLS